MRKIAVIFLSISLNICFGSSKEPSHREGSFEYPEHMFKLRNKKNNFKLRTLIWGPERLLHSFFLSQIVKLGMNIQFTSRVL